MQRVKANTAEGREILAYSEDRISKLHHQLAVPGLPERDADLMRGRIVELRKLADWINNAEHET